MPLFKRKIDLYSLGSCVSHEVNTQIEAIKVGMSGLNDLLPALVQSYKLAKANGLTLPEISNRQLGVLVNMAENIHRESSFISFYINNLATNLKAEVKNKLIEKLLFSKVIDMAIDSYRYSSERQRTLISIIRPESDFELYADRKQIITLFHNLIRIAVSDIEKQGSGLIKFSLAVSRRSYVISMAYPYLAKTQPTGDRGDIEVGYLFCHKILKGINGFRSYTQTHHDGHCLHKITIKNSTGEI